MASNGHHRFWLVAGGLLIGLSVLGRYVFGSPTFLRISLPHALGAAAVPFAVKLGYELFRRWGDNMPSFVARDEQEVRSWLNEQLAPLANLRPQILCGLFFITWGGLAAYSTGAFDASSIEERVARGCFVMAGAFASGVAIYCLFFMGCIAFRLGRFRVRLEGHPFGVLSTGRLLTKCFSLGAGIWALVAMSATAKPETTLLILMLIAVPTALFMAAIFFVSQVPLHNRMVETKLEMLNSVQENLRHLLPVNADDLTEERRESIRFLEERRRLILKLPEWPFAWLSFAGVTSGWFASSVVPWLVSSSVDMLVSEAAGSL